MYDFTGELRPYVNYSKKGNPIITIEVDDTVRPHYMVDELKDAKISIKIGKFKQKRSLDANAYFHVLVNKIAGKTKSSDDEVKRTLFADMELWPGMTKENSLVQ